MVKTCDNSNFIQSPFLNVYTIIFAFSVKYFSNTCPLIFKNSQINQITFYGFSQTFLKYNILEFNNKVYFQNLNSNITTVNLNLYKFNLTRNFLNKFVFSQTKLLILNGLLTDIQQGIFEDIPLSLVLNFN